MAGIEGFRNVFALGVNARAGGGEQRGLAYAAPGDSGDFHMVSSREAPPDPGLKSSRRSKQSFPKVAAGFGIKLCGIKGL